MSARRVCDFVNKVVFDLVGESLALDANSHVVESINASRETLSWKSPNGKFGLIPGISSSIDEYVSIVSSRNYSVLLNDGGLIQTSYVFESGKIAKHRLSYHCCPIELDDFRAAIEEFGVADAIEEALLEDARANLRLRSSVRFDYDPGAAAVYHPASHMTLHSDRGRIPVSAPLSFQAFVRFVFETFYTDWWQECRVFRDWPAASPQDCLSADDAGRTHVRVS